MEILHHALLYALLCKNILQIHEEEGKQLIEAFTKEYGRSRGRRMRANSENGDLNDYFINGEWKGRPGENISKLSYEKDKTVSVVTKCAWYDTWKDYGLLEYGSYYCRYIDQAIAEGFDQDLVLNVKGSLGKGDEHCIFEWLQAADEEKVSSTERKHILPFDFHCKEMLECAGRILKKDDPSIERSVRQFKEYFPDTEISV
ncbi:MAG: L-2-amino-thiazoline-4-carboxylic acid hydrolase [Erysipelotrichaceae bacterium]|nr:L-2-amino-thiazoline-4-carboxylic acid hydrolase [Erysipelotrichaceae bacterium]